MFDAIKRLAKEAGIAPGLSTSNNLVRAGWPASQAGARHEPRVRGPYPLFGGCGGGTASGESRLPPPPAAVVFALGGVGGGAGGRGASPPALENLPPSAQPSPFGLADT